MSATVPVASTRERVLAALDRVIDPELDEPITTLRFISSCEVTPEGEVSVGLRLPTPQCAPNFAFLMAADARRAIWTVPEVRGVRVTLEDHYTGDEINDALRRGEGFTGAFPGETEDDQLDTLRGLFQRKALTARQSRICEELLAGGAAPEDVVALRMSELPDGLDARRCRQLRLELGLAADPGSPAFLLADGEVLTPDQLPRWMRMGRLIRTSLETNGGICRSLLQFRHNLAPDTEEVGG